MRLGEGTEKNGRGKRKKWIERGRERRKTKMGDGKQRKGIE